MGHREESLVILTSNRSMVEEVILAEEDVTKEVEVEKEVEELFIGATNATSWVINHLNVHGQRGAYVAQNEQQQEESTMANVFPETGESLMMNKVLLKPKKEQAEPAQGK